MRNFSSLLLFFTIFCVFHTSYSQNKLNDDLIDAVKNSDLKKTQELVKSGADVNYINPSGNFPLFFADHDWKIVVAEFLLRSGADPNLQNSDGNTLLHEICNDYSSYSEELVRLLYYYKADKTIINSEGKTPVQIAETKRNNYQEFLKNPKLDIYFLVRFGSLKEIKDYFKKFKSEVNKPDEYGYTLISYAVGRSDGDLNILKYLLEKGANPELTSWEFIDIAIEKENHKLVETLLNESDFSIPPQPILITIRNDNFEMFKLLFTYPIKSESDSYEESKFINELLNLSDLKYFDFILKNGYDINKTLYDNSTPLHFACGYEDYPKIEIVPDIIDFLLKNGADPNSKDENGNTPLVTLVNNKADFDVIKKLFEHGVNVNELNEQNQNIIHHLVRGNKSPEIIDFFVEKGAKIDLVDTREETPLYIACKKRNVEQIEYLIKKGADISKLNFAEIVSFSDHPVIKKIIEKDEVLESLYEGHFALHYAAIRDDIEITKLLMESGADVNVMNKYSETPLHLSKSVALTDYLISKGAKVNAKAKKNEKLMNFTPLDYAILNKNIGKINYLLDKGAKSNNSYGIHEAVLMENIELLNYYIENKTNIDLENKSQYTPLQLACGCQAFSGMGFEPNTEIVKILLENDAKLIPRNSKTVLECAAENNNTGVINLIKRKLAENVKNIKKKNALIENDLIIFNRIPLNSNHYGYYRDNSALKFYKDLYFECSALNYIDFSSLLLKKFLDKSYDKYWSYEPYFDSRSKYLQKEVDSRLGESTDTVYDIDPETGEFIPIVLKNHADKLELDGIIFYDDWYFDEYDFKMYKTVKAYSPIRTYYREDDIDSEDVRQKLIGYFVFDNELSKKEKKRSDKRMKLFKSIQYEFYLENEESRLYRNDDGYYDMDLDLYLEKRNSPFWTSYARTKFRNIIIDRVLSTQSKAYAFYSGKELTVKYIREKLGERIDTIYDLDPETGETIPNILKNPIILEEIKSFIFIENWYVDEESMRIKKEVVGVAPVRTYYRDGDFDREVPQKNIPFIVYFNKPKFDEFRALPISVNVPIDSNKVTLSYSPSNINFYYNEENLENFNFKQNFINASTSGRISLFMPDSEFDDYENFKTESYKKLSIDDVRSRIGLGTDTIYVIDPDTGEEVKKAVKKEGYGKDSVSVINFFETWYFDKKNFKFKKNISAYSPAIRFYRDDELYYDKPSYKLCGYVLNNETEGSNNDFVLFKKVKYEFGFEESGMNTGNNIPEVEKDKALFWNNFKSTTFKEEITDMALKGEVNAYDFESGKKLTVNEIEKNLLIRIDTIYDIDPETGETILLKVKYKINHKMINSFIFIENWYINKTTFAIRKEVVGIAPVVYVFDDPNDKTEEFRKIIPFVLYFDEIKKF